MKASYDLAIVGAGSTGLTAADFAVKLGARVALLEKSHTGGECTWTGCVPSKTFVKAAKVAHQMRTADRYGLPFVAPQVNLKSVMDHVRAVIHDVYDEETPDKLRAQGIDVYLGPARFLDLHTQVAGNLVYLRLEFSTGDASGHNMVTAAADRAAAWIRARHPDLRFLSVSGNYCTDKKVSAVNGILGRGKVAGLCLPGVGPCRGEQKHRSTKHDTHQQHQQGGLPAGHPEPPSSVCIYNYNPTTMEVEYRASGGESIHQK